MSTETENTNTIRLTCKNCGLEEGVGILSKGEARKNGYNDTSKYICYGKCQRCAALYMIHLPTKIYHQLSTAAK